MNGREILEYYSRKDVQKAILEFAKHREVVGVFKNGEYGSRPNVLLYPEDITSMVRSGVVEFHSSIELWSNPMNVRQDNHHELRKGWDIILDLDCEDIEHGKIASNVLCWALKRHGIRDFSIKFTGGSGFHIGIPWEAIPRRIDYKDSVGEFPELPRKVGLYLKSFCRERLGQALLKRFTPEELAAKVKKPLGEILSDYGIDPYKVVEIDPILISPRHLFRMPYSLHRSSFLVSLPINPKDVMDFSPERARPDKIDFRGFLKGGGSGEAGGLIAEALDWWSKKRLKEKKREFRERIIQRAIPESMFPPCVKNVLVGLQDGRKRSVFILLNFLRSVKWEWKDIERLLGEWNQKNKPPLGENYIRGQFRWHKNRGKSILPPNCVHEGWYASFGVCKPDQYCGFEERNVKNPVNYPFRLMGKVKSKKGKK